MINEAPLVPRPEIDEDEAADELVKADGNISKAAKRMGVDSAALRVFVDCSPRLRAVIDETFESAIDDAIGVLFEGLHDQGSFLNRFYAAKEFLRTEAGRRRGFGREHVGASLELKNTETGAKVITLKWLNPPDEAPSQPPSQVENAS
jgi:hypothetical protein